MAVSSLHLHVNGVNYVVSGIPNGTSYKDVLCSIAKTRNDGLEKEQTLFYSDLVAREKGHEGRKAGFRKRKDSFKSDSVNGTGETRKWVRHPTLTKSPKGIKKDILNQTSHQQSKQTKHGPTRKQPHLKRRAMSFSSVRSNRLSMDDSDIEKMRQTNRKLANEMKRTTHEDSDAKMYDNLVKLIGSQRKRIESQHQQLSDGRIFHRSNDLRKISFYFIDEEIDKEEVSSDRLVTNDGQYSKKSGKKAVGKGNSKRNKKELGVDNKAYKFTDDNDSGIPSGESEEASSREDNRFDIRFKGFLGAISQVQMKSTSCPVLVSRETELANKATKLKDAKVLEATRDVAVENKLDNVSTADIHKNENDFVKSIQEVLKDSKERDLQETRSEQAIADERKENVKEREIVYEGIEINDTAVELNGTMDKGEDDAKVEQEADLMLNRNVSCEDLSGKAAMMEKDCFPVLNEDTGFYSMKKVETEGTCEGAESVEEATVRQEQFYELTNLQSSVTESQFSDSADCLSLTFDQIATKGKKCVSSADRRITEQNRGSFVLIDFDDFNDEIRINDKTSSEYLENIDNVSIISLGVLDNIPELHAGRVFEEPEKEEDGSKNKDVSQSKDNILILKEVNSLRKDKEEAVLIGNAKIPTMKEALNVAKQKECQHETEFKDEAERKEFEHTKIFDCQSNTRSDVKSPNQGNCRLENSSCTANNFIDRRELKVNSKEYETFKENDENSDTVEINEACSQEHPVIKEDVSNIESSYSSCSSTNERRKSEEEPEVSRSLLEAMTRKSLETNFENSIDAEKDLKNDILQAGTNKNTVVNDLVSLNSEKSRKFSWFRKKSRRTRIGRGIFEKEENGELKVNIRRTQQEKSGEGFESEMGKTQQSSPFCDLGPENGDVNNNNFDGVVATETSFSHDAIVSDVSVMKRKSEENNNNSAKKAVSQVVDTNVLNRKQFWKKYRQICDKIHNIAETLLYYDLLTEHRHFELKELLILQKSHDDDVLERDEIRVINEIKEFKNYLRSVTMFTKYQRDKILQNEIELQRIEEILANKRALFFSLEKCLWLKRFVHTPRLLLRKYNDRKFPGKVVTKRGSRQVIRTSSCRV